MLLIGNSNELYESNTENNWSDFTSVHEALVCFDSSLAAWEKVAGVRLQLVGTLHCS